MGLFDFLSSADSKRAEEVRKGAVAPDRTERKKCWEARDGFYACLDKHNVIDSLNGAGKKTAEKECGKENKQFEEDCAAAWVTYFKKYRVAEYQKKKTFERLGKEGARQISVEGAGNSPR